MSTAPTTGQLSPDVTAKLPALWDEASTAYHAASTALRTEPILQFFAYAHLPVDLAGVSEPFCRMAYDLVAKLPRNPERTVALRKLLESKDAAVRAAVYRDTARST